MNLANIELKKVYQLLSIEENIESLDFGKLYWNILVYAEEFKEYKSKASIKFKVLELTDIPEATREAIESTIYFEANEVEYIKYKLLGTKDDYLEYFL